MNIPFLTPLLNTLGTLGSKWVELKKVEADGRIKIAYAQAEAQAKVVVTRAQAEAAWENIQAENAGSSWKDEWFTILVSIPLILVFIPQTVEYVQRGFDVLATAPEWYLWTLGAAISAAFGIRTGFFERIGEAMNKPKAPKNVVVTGNDELSKALKGALNGPKG